MRKFWLTSAALSLLAAGAAQAQQVKPPFDDVVSFGDSHSDIGNWSNALTPGAFNSYTTNPGNTAVENVAEHYGVDQKPSVLPGGTNYAIGGQRIRPDFPGATNPAVVATNNLSLWGQVRNYLGDVGGVIGPNTLITYMGGGNDIFSIDSRVESGAFTLQAGIADAQVVAREALDQITLLQNAGAKTIVVFGLSRFLTSPTAGTLANAFNETLNTGLAGRTGIVPVNLRDLWRGFTQEAADYGLTNVKDNACTVPVLQCTLATLREPNADQTYFFADSIHPTTIVHQMTSQVVLSELAAPQQISFLAETPLAFGAVVRSTVRSAALAPEEGSRLFASLSPHSQGFDRSWDVGEADDDGATLTFGGLVQARENLVLGAALSAGKASPEINPGLAYDSRALMGTVFGRVTIAYSGYLTADAFTGELAFHDVARSIAIGPSRRVEHGRTEGELYGGSIAGGWWFDNGAVFHGPFAEVSAQTVKVGGYAESGTRGTAMTFGAQERESLVTEFGWQARGSADIAGVSLTPFGSVSYAKDSEADAREVWAGLVTMNGTFSMPAFVPAEDWVSVGVGAGFELAPGLEGEVGYRGQFGDTQNLHSLAFSLRKRL